MTTMVDVRVALAAYAFERLFGGGDGSFAVWRHGSSAPVGVSPRVDGTWHVGDVVWNTVTSSGGAVGWMCTTAGSPGTWTAFGFSTPGGTENFLRADGTWAPPAGGVPTSRTITAGAGLTGGGDLSADRTFDVAVTAPIVISGDSVAFDTTAALNNNARVTLRKNTGADVGTRRRVNLIEGSNVTLTVTDDAGSEEIDVTIAAAGGSGAPTDAEYIVGATHASLSAERLVTDTATVAWDLGTPGQAKANVPDDAITYAKIQNITDARILGRSAGVAGDAQEITIGSPILLAGGTLDFDETAALGNNARVTVRKNTGADVGTRRRLNLVEGSNIALTVTDDAPGEEVDVTIAVTGIAGGGASGTGEIDFGAFPGTDTASIAVADAGIGAGSIVKAWLRYADTSGGPTGSHSADEHLVDGPEIYAGSISAGVGFTVYAAMKRDLPVQDTIVNRGRYSPNNNTPKCYGPWAFAWQRV